MSTLYLLNTSVMPQAGRYVAREVDIDFCRNMIADTLARGEAVISAVGHESTANHMSRLLAFTVPMNRIQVELRSNDVMLCFKPKERIPEGAILSTPELEALPQTWLWVNYLSI